MNELFGAKYFLDPEDLGKLLSRLAVDLFFATIVIRFVYYRLYKNREYVFTYFLFNVITFCLCFLLRKVPIELGFALGLFAVFGILRYRTEPIKIRDLTYLFIVIGLGILNAVSNKKISVVELLAVNAIITGLTALLELAPGRIRERSTPILYDNIELLRPSMRAELHADLGTRLGVEVSRVDIQRVDMLRDAAELVVFYRAAVDEATEKLQGTPKTPPVAPDRDAADALIRRDEHGPQQDPNDPSDLPRATARPRVRD